MKLIINFFRFTGMLTLMVFTILYLLGDKDFSIAVLAISITCFFIAIVLKLYWLYALNKLMENAQDSNQTFNSLHEKT